MALIAMLVAMLMAVMARSRQAADQLVCLTNLGQLEKAHWVYMTDNDGMMLGTEASGPKSSWIKVLQSYDDQLLLRSPIDTSPHFSDGTPVHGQFRLTSYAINANLSPDSPVGLQTIDEVVMPSQAVHFVIKVFEGPNAVMDQVNPRAWHAPGLQRALANAAEQIQVNAHGGRADSVRALSAYGFLDGHAERLAFEDVYG